MLHCLPWAGQLLLAIISLTDYWAARPVASAGGVVLTEQGAPLPSAAVQLAGTTQFAITNAEGEFVLTLPEPAPQVTLKISCRGYRDTEAVWYASKPLRVVMKSNVGMGAGSTPLPSADASTGTSPSHSQALKYAEVMPSFVGGEAAYRAYISKNAHYPPEALAKRVSSTVTITFVVDEKGRILDAEVLKGGGDGFDEEALRVIRLMPWWQPGLMAGKPVRVAVIVRVPFVFQESTGN